MAEPPGPVLVVIPTYEERDNLGPTLDMGRNTSDAPIDEKGGAPIVLL